MSSFYSINDVWNYLDTIPKFHDKGVNATNFTLKNIIDFCESIGNPQNSYPSIHVAGTNGKGTTCYLLEAVYKQAGFKPGMFTSPHLLRYNERIRISGEEAHDVMILHFFQKFELELKKTSLTYFEISTALAFWIFSEKKIDIAIIEAGLGGRLDSTNIISPELSIITNIGLDHQDILGDSIEEIAFEKVGIVKEGIPVILGNINSTAERVIKEQAEKKNSVAIKCRDINPDWDNGKVRISNDNFSTNLVEPVNRWNVASVFLAVKALKSKFDVSKDDFKKMLGSFKGVPARFEKLHPEKDWYFSGAHNKEALESTCNTANEISPKKPVFIFSMMKDKVNSEMISLYKPYKNIYYFDMETERGASFKDIQQWFPVKKIDKSTAKSILKELETSLVIFTGSFYFYSTVKRWVNKSKSHQSFLT